MSDFRFPKRTNRTSIVGSTGSGKSQAATWLLSTRDIQDRPWLILDPKGDDLIGTLPYEDIKPGGKLPREPGIYRAKPLPGFHDEWQEELLMHCFQQEDCGIYIDEGYTIPRNSRAFRSLLTQGRSKHIEMIMCSQRPAWCHPMMFSESDFLQVFRLNKPGDRDTMQDLTSLDIRKRLPSFHSYWYDVGRDQGFVMKPVPDADTITASFERFKKRKLRMV